MILNKLYDFQDSTRPEIQHLYKLFQTFSDKIRLAFHPLKWFEYSYALLYSDHLRPCKVLDIGSAETLFPFFLKQYNYDVTTLDLEYTNFRKIAEPLFNIKALTGDLRIQDSALTNQFDFVTCLSVIEHIDYDTKAILNAASYVKPGGTLFISTDFYKTYIEYPDANKIIVTDRPEGSHTPSRIYTEETFMSRIIDPLEKQGIFRKGETNYKNVDINDPSTYAVRKLYTFGIATLQKEK